MTIKLATTARAAALASGTAQAAHSYLVEITGSGEATFTGECTVDGPGGEQRIALAGSAPWRRVLTGRGVRCRLEQTSSGGSLVLSVRRLDGGASQTASLQGGGGSALIALR